VAWSRWLEADYWDVELVPPFKQDDPDGAPLEPLRNGEDVRRPDIRATKAATGARPTRMEWWEVKYRSRAEINPLSGVREHWMSYDAYRDYLRLALDTDAPLWIILRLESNHLNQAMWLQISIRSLRRLGRRDTRVTGADKEVSAWVWPESAMTIVEGPEVSAKMSEAPLLPIDDHERAIKAEELEAQELALRELSGDKESLARRRRILDDPITALDVLRQRSDVKIPNLPRYSVLKIGDGDVNRDQLLGLLQYGIRVFLITSKPPSETDRKTYLPFIASRLLEWSYTDVSKAAGFCAVDGIAEGQRFSDWPDAVKKVLWAADDNGGINVGQYEIVHAAQTRDIVITAGAGTGKTETMSERIIYLLATSALVEERDTQMYPYDLKMNDIVLVTFTREAATQMRERIARVLNLRRRLCPRCVLAAVPWMFQLTATQISTIHLYARHVAQQSAASIGFNPNLAVSSLTLELRQIMNDALSPHLTKLLNQRPTAEDRSHPAAHEWLSHMERIWEALANNGVPILPIGGSPIPEIDWGLDDCSDSTTRTYAEMFKHAIVTSGREFTKICEENDVLPVNQLVPAALQGLLSAATPRIGNPRYLFVDEFQDTDGKQMDLILEISQRLDARLFVVGDVKQGIYRFRGAEGSAFTELSKRMKLAGMPEALKLNLNRNFRTGGELLRSMHKHFAVWGKTSADNHSPRPLLDYGPSDVLKPQVERKAEGTNLRFKETSYDNYLNDLSQQIEAWLTIALTDPQKPKKIGILCRQNWIANKVRDRLRGDGLPCNVLVGGTFYQSEAVREARVLLEAVMAPENTAAVLELCETRWFGGLSLPQEPPDGAECDEFWRHEIPPILGWADRLPSLSAQSTESLETGDLEPVRARLRSLNQLIQLMSPVALLAQCHRKFEPQLRLRSGTDVEKNSDLPAYSRCLDHLLVLLDLETATRPLTLPSLVDWLRIQIATNNKEDEPQPKVLDLVTALTVHKAKGQEFDFVIIPHTWAQFESSEATSLVSVTRSESTGKHKVMWRWRLEDQDELRNFDDQSASAQAETGETRREEARLLYVAMTRARDELVIFQRKNPKTNTWGELLMLAGQ
jgi:superfamily I DNA/RNA helicase